jgi:hypothetical protein
VLERIGGLGATLADRSTEWMASDAIAMCS